MNTIEDTYKVIRDKLSPTDWLALTLTCQQYYHWSTDKERQSRVHARHGLPYCCIHDYVDSVRLLLEKRKDSASSTNSFIMAAGNESYKVMEWLLKHRPEVKQGLHLALYTSPTDKCTQYLLQYFNRNRRYSYVTQIKYGRVEIKPDVCTTFSYNDYLTINKYNGSEILGKKLQQYLD